MRRWADAGQVRAYRTAGGHRRFALEELQALVAGRAGGGRYGPVGELAVHRIRRRLHGHEPDWYGHVPAEARPHLGSLGRQLAGLVTAFLEQPQRRSRLLAQAREVGTAYGRELAGTPLSLGEAVRAFGFFRRQLEETTAQLVRRQGLPAEDAVAAWRQVSALADQVLMAITLTYEAAGAEAAPP